MTMLTIAASGPWIPVEFWGFVSLFERRKDGIIRSEWDGDMSSFSKVDW